MQEKKKLRVAVIQDSPVIMDKENINQFIKNLPTRPILPAIQSLPINLKL